MEPLIHLLKEMERAKQAVQVTLSEAPDNVQLHRINAMYVDRILDIKKALFKEKSIDKDRLLLDFLYTIIKVLLECGEKIAAQAIGNHLEEIGKRVKETWQDLKASQTLQADMRVCESSFLEPSLPSKISQKRKKSKGKTKP